MTPQGQRRYGVKKGEYGRQLAMTNALAVIAGVLSTGTSTPQQSSNKPSQKNLEVSKLGTVLIPAPLAAPSVPGSALPEI